MALDSSPNDVTLFNVVARYERQIGGGQLTQSEIARVADDAKRLVIDQLHSLKALR